MFGRIISFIGGFFKVPGLFAAHYFFGGFFELGPGNHDLSAAAQALYAEIHTHTPDLPFVTAARMFLFHFYHIAYAKVQELPSSFSLPFFI
jgi:hypothetical protein